MFTFEFVFYPMFFEGVRARIVIWLTAIVLTVLVCASFMFNFVEVPANTVAIKHNNWGGGNEVVQEGTYLVNSAKYDYFIISTTTQERSMDGDKALTAQSKDGLPVYFDTNLKYEIPKENAFIMFEKYNDVETFKKTSSKNIVEDALLEVVSQYTAEEAVGAKSSEIRTKVAEICKEKYAEDGVVFKSITFKKIRGTDALMTAIDAEVTATKAVDKAEQDRLKAEKDAETARITAQGEADANKILSEGLTQDVKFLKYLEKWDGKLPVVYGADGNLFDITTLLQADEK